MMGLLAGFVVAVATLGYVLEPLMRPPPSRRPAVPPESPDELVQRMRERLLTKCPRCAIPAETGSAFCSRCGGALVEG
jgi:hypothetical protein